MDDANKMVKKSFTSNQLNTMFLLAKDCRELPHRQLKNGCPECPHPQACELPHRQLKNMSNPAKMDWISELPHRQLKKALHQGLKSSLSELPYRQLR